MTLMESDDMETITMHQTFANHQKFYFERKTKLDRKIGDIYLQLMKLKNH